MAAVLPPPRAATLRSAAASASGRLKPEAWRCAPRGLVVASQESAARQAAAAVLRGASVASLVLSSGRGGSACGRTVTLLAAGALLVAPRRGRGPGRRRPGRQATPPQVAGNVAVQGVTHINELKYPPTWSNPCGAVLTTFVPGFLWAAERPFIWNGIDVGGKMAVARLPDGALWVHSPVALDVHLRGALEALGPVRHIVSPNFEHVKYARQWREAFPEATLWGSPGMLEKFKDIPYDRELSRESEPPREWLGALDMAFLDYETLPFTDIPFFNEVIFHQRATRTLLCTDSFWSYPDDGLPQGSAAWKFGMDRVYLPFYKGLMIRHPGALGRVLDRVSGWDPVALLPCHGVYQARGAAATFLSHLGRG